MLPGAQLTRRRRRRARTARGTAAAGNSDARPRHERVAFRRGTQPRVRLAAPAAPASPGRSHWSRRASMAASSPAALPWSPSRCASSRAMAGASRRAIEQGQRAHGRLVEEIAASSTRPGCQPSCASTGICRVREALKRVDRLDAQAAPCSRARRQPRSSSRASAACASCVRAPVVVGRIRRRRRLRRRAAPRGRGASFRRRPCA